MGQRCVRCVMDAWTQRIRLWVVHAFWRGQASIRKTTTLHHGIRRAQSKVRLLLFSTHGETDPRVRLCVLPLLISVWVHHFLGPPPEACGPHLNVSHHPTLFVAVQALRKGLCEAGTTTLGQTLSILTADRPLAASRQNFPPDIQSSACE